MPRLDKNEIKKFNSYMEHKYFKRKDKNNIYGVGITDSEFVMFVINIFLGGEWYVADPLGHNQVNEEALYAILDKFDKKWRRY